MERMTVVNLVKPEIVHSLTLVRKFNFITAYSKSTGNTNQLPLHWLLSALAMKLGSHSHLPSLHTADGTTHSALSSHISPRPVTIRKCL